MNENFPNKNIPGAPSLWVANPKLKNLLLIFIFVFLACGIGLIVFKQAQTAYRQKLYNDTQSGLAKHQAKPAAASTTPDTATWKTYVSDQYGFTFDYPSEFTNFKPNSLYAAYASSPRGNIRIEITQAPFNPKNIQDANSNKVTDAKKMTLGTQTGYGFMEQKNEYGCGDFTVQTSLQTSTLSIHFGSCDTDPGMHLYDDTAMIQHVLSTFKFTK